MQKHRPAYKNQYEGGSVSMLPIDTILYNAPDTVYDLIFRKAAETGFYIARTFVLSEGRIKLLQYFIEQSISHNYHRYGNFRMRVLK